VTEGEQGAPRGRSKHEPDSRIVWDDIGVDLLVDDEAANLKVRHMPSMSPQRIAL
jgi:hypothetical protein